MTKLSIVIPVYNVESYLRKCIESVLSPGLGDYEIVLVNDGSTDSSPEICAEYAAQYPDKISEFSDKPEKIQPKVAQNAPLFGNNQASKHKEDKKVIDNGDPSPYSGLEDRTPSMLSDEQKILSALTKEARSIDDVIAETGIPTARMLATLTLLQVKGMVKQHPGKRISLK